MFYALGYKSLLNVLRHREKHEEKEIVSVENCLREFILPNRVLKEMIYDMDQEMTKGLKGGLSMSTIAMLPSFVPTLPDGTESGSYLAMDLGGTNLRVMLLKLDPTTNNIHTESRNFKVPMSAMTSTGASLFDYMVSGLGDFLEEKKLSQANLPLGFTFSYPCDQTGLRSSKLLRWTKGFNATGVEGNDVVKLLEDAIARHKHIKVKVAALLNDTVGTQIATAHDNKTCELGVIVGTGTNASYMERVERIEKLQLNNYPHKEMIIDTEWGGFGDGGIGDYIKTRYDRTIDERSVHPGVQSFDKLVAGMYMGEQVRLVLEKLVRAKLLFNGEVEDDEPLFQREQFPTKYISEILADEGGQFSHTRQILDELGVEQHSFSDLLILREICMAVSRRSACLTAAAITCILKRIGKPKVTVGIDGSTYKYHPFYHSWVQEKLRELLPDVEVHLVQAGDGSGKGAALVAAIAERLHLNDDESTA